MAQKKLWMTGSVHGGNIPPETQFIETRLRVDTTPVLSIGGSLPNMGAAGERPDIDVKPRLGAPLMIFPRDYLLKSYTQGDSSARQRGFEIRVPLLSELPKAVEPHLPVCQLYHWQLGHNVWSSTTTGRKTPIVAAAHRVDFPGGKTCTCHLWICMQFFGARGMDNGGVRAHW